MGKAGCISELISIRQEFCLFDETRSLKIHIIGGPGSGKTTLARCIASKFGVPHYDLDHVLMKYGDQVEPITREAFSLAQQPGWVTEGVFLLWVDPLLCAADTIVLLEIPWQLAVWRILRRHINLSLRGINPHPTRLLPGFVKFSRGYYVETIADGSEVDEALKSYAAMHESIGPAGDAETWIDRCSQHRHSIPLTAAVTRRYLRAYQEKVFTVTSRADRSRLLEHLSSQYSHLRGSEER